MNLACNRDLFPGNAGARQSGVSLVELMVALVIAALLGIGLVQVFGSTRAAFNSNNALARAQENSRFALQFINEDLRLAAHLGTRNEQGAVPGVAEDPVANLLFNHMAAAAPSNGNPTTAPWALRLDVPFEAYNFNGTGIGNTYTLPDPPVAATAASNWTPTLPSELSVLATSALAGSDIIVVRYLSPDFVTLVNSRARADGMAVSSNIPFNPSTGVFYWLTQGSPDFIEENGIYAFSNARAISLFQVTSVTGDPADTERSAITIGGNNTRGWETNRPRGANLPDGSDGEVENPADYGSLLPVHRYEMVVYYVAIGADNVSPSLFRRRLAPDKPNYIGEPEEMVPGVESLQVVMGVVNQFPRNADQPLAYMTADMIESDSSWSSDPLVRWRGVVSARVGLLMRSQQPGGTSQETDVDRDVAGTIVSPASTDRHVRHVYESQVAFRNRNRG